MTNAAVLPSQAALAEESRQLQGPILVLGSSSGFVGANLLRSILAVRKDVYGTTTRLPPWRLADRPAEHVKQVDLLIDSNLDTLLAAIRAADGFQLRRLQRLFVRNR